MMQLLTLDPHHDNEQANANPDLQPRDHVFALKPAKMASVC